LKIKLKYCFPPHHHHHRSTDSSISGCLMYRTWEIHAEFVEEQQKIEFLTVFVTPSPANEWRKLKSNITFRGFYSKLTATIIITCFAVSIFLFIKFCSIVCLMMSCNINVCVDRKIECEWKFQNLKVFN
jgi:hypothetical protein